MEPVNSDDQSACISNQSNQNLYVSSLPYLIDPVQFAQTGSMVPRLVPHCKRFLFLVTSFF